MANYNNKPERLETCEIPNGRQPDVSQCFTNLLQSMKLKKESTQERSNASTSWISLRSDARSIDEESDATGMGLTKPCPRRARAPWMVKPCS
ncbi:hypothetical protein SAMN05216404_102147 [Nitrosospira multiformis]|uniref:Uncharacterized protein n=1 Tax=Nitrosospira multiformis TaxID=1231 RepID=A0A1H8D3D8_9PROT|nr:hypothetical protein SAMN05216404_102147 [Nitrosospira multiformis]